MRSQKSRDGLLISVLIRLYALRTERMQMYEECIEVWRHRLSVLCIGLALLWGVSYESKSCDVMILTVLGFTLPQAYGKLIIEHVRFCGRTIKDEEVGEIATCIYDEIAEITSENPTYITIFNELLEALLDEDVRRSVLRAEELDGYGKHALRLTALVHQVHA